MESFVTCIQRTKAALLAYHFAACASAAGHVCSHDVGWHKAVIQHSVG